MKWICISKHSPKCEVISSVMTCVSSTISVDLQLKDESQINITVVPHITENAHWVLLLAIPNTPCIYEVTRLFQNISKNFKHLGNFSEIY